MVNTKVGFQRYHLRSGRSTGGPLYAAPIHEPMAGMVE
jgi:hypothetical protein